MVESFKSWLLRVEWLAAMPYGEALAAAVSWIGVLALI